MEEGNSEKQKKKNSGGSRKFNQIGTNGICFSVSPAPSVPKQVRKSQGKWGKKQVWQILPCKTGPRCRSPESIIITIQYFRSLALPGKNCRRFQFRSTLKPSHCFLPHLVLLTCIIFWFVLNKSPCVVY